jgi:hypothetical protein
MALRLADLQVGGDQPGDTMVTKSTEIGHSYEEREFAREREKD